MQIFWKAYFFFWLVLSSSIVWAPYVLPIEIEPWGFFEYVEALLWPVGLLGLYGFAFNRGFGKAVYWKVIFLIILVVELGYPTVCLIEEWPAIIGEMGSEFGPFLLAGFVLVVPFYLALYLYGWRSKTVWKSAS
jgi:hypothetical protein